MIHRDRSDRLVFARRVALVLGTLTALALSGCTEKEEEFFDFLTGVLQEDTFAPEFSNARPTCANPIISTDNYMVEVADANAVRPSSGLDPDGFAASANGTVLPVQAIGNGTVMMTIDVSGLPDGPSEVEARARDRAGNEATFNWSKILDRILPVAEFEDPTDEAFETAEDVLAVLIRVLLSDENFDRGTLKVVDAGPNGTCNDSDDQDLLDGILDTSERTLEEGEHEIEIPFQNIVEPGGVPLEVIACLILIARDLAVSKDGEPGVNTTTATKRLDLTFLGAPLTTGAVEGFVTLDGEGVEDVEVTVAGRPPVTTDGNGYYRIAGIPPGEIDVRLTRVPDDVHCPVTSKKTTIVVGETKRVDFECVPFGSISGIATLDGEPIVGSVVEITGPNGFSMFVPGGTDANGRFMTGPVLPPGRYEVRVGTEGCPRVTADVVAGKNTEVTIRCTSQLTADQIAGDWDFVFTLNEGETTCPGDHPDIQDPGVEIVRLSDRRLEIRFSDGTVVRGDYDPATGEFDGESAPEDVGPGVEARVEMRGEFARGPDGTLRFEGSADTVARDAISGEEICRIAYEADGEKT